jgi:hypothetical protein
MGIYNHNQIIEWIEKKYSSDLCYEVHRNLEDFPELLKDIKFKPDLPFDFSLPIDLICAKKEDEPTENGKGQFWHYTIFLVNSTNTFSKSLKKRLSFYQFYLSQIPSVQPNRFVIITAIPFNFPALKQKDKEFFENNGFGIWRINTTKLDKQEDISPKNLRDRMIEEFNKAVDEKDETDDDIIEAAGDTSKNNQQATLKKALPINKISENIGIDLDVLRENIKTRAKDFVLFFEEYIDDAIEGIAGISPGQFGTRYIDRKVMDEVLDLKNISYKTELSNLMNEHLTEKGNEYEFTSEIFTALWDSQIGLPYSHFLEKFEPSLLYVFADSKKGDKIYRDHYLHQFQVFLLGISIIDYCPDRFRKDKYKKPEIIWLIASSFHDIAYPVQLYDEWCKKFFTEVFSIPKSPASLELKTNFVDHSFLYCMSCIIDEFYRVHLNGEKGSNKEENEIVQFFYKQITEIKNHGILSSISLLKMISPINSVNKNEKKIKKKLGLSLVEAWQNIFVPSVLAITLHDYKIWGGLLKEKTKDKSPRLLTTLKFDNDPISFLLIFCDNVQEWGRPCKTEDNEGDGKIKRFYLKNFECHSNPNEIKITIWSPNHKSSFFSNDEFGASLNIENLCKAINKYKIEFAKPNSSIERLNELLQIPNFYNIWFRKNKSYKTKLSNLNGYTKGLIDLTKSYRIKTFTKLDKYQKQKIVELNRLILEVSHIKNCPKNFFRQKRDELKKIQSFLQQPSDIKFIIQLEDNEEYVEVFEMKGA